MTFECAVAGSSVTLLIISDVLSPNRLAPNGCRLHLNHDARNGRSRHWRRLVCRLNETPTFCAQAGASGSRAPGKGGPLARRTIWATIGRAIRASGRLAPTGPAP